MAFTDSERNQFTAIVPDGPSTPTVPAHLQGIVDAIEKQVVLRAPDWPWADTFIAPYEDGMILFVEDIASLYHRVEGAWKKLSPTSYTDSVVPADTLGEDGDLFFLTA